MEIRLEDLQTEEMHPVDGGGVTLGRDSRRSSIVIADPGVSGAHARIFERSGRFFIEDSNSSNGTFVEGTRLRGELELKDGFVIALHKYKFRVMIDGGSAGDSTALFEPKGSGKPAKKAMAGAPTRTQARQDARQTDPDEAAIEDDRADELEDRAPGGRRPTDSRADARRDSQQIIRDPGIDDEESLFEEEVRRGEERSAAAKSSKVDIDSEQLKAGFGKALAYYLGAVPKMALTPKGSVTKLIAEQPFKAMEKMELALWAAPPLALGSIVALIAAIVVGLVTGTFGVGSILSPLIYGVITVVVGAAVAGWVWHPFMTWWVKLLKGESDPQSRTNMMIATFTALSLVYIATGVGVLFTLLVRIPLIGPFVQIGPLVLMCAASLLSLYVWLVWHNYFRVTHWVPKVIVALGVLTIANAAWGAIGFIRAGVSSATAVIADSPAGHDGLTPEQRKQVAAAQAAAQAAGLSAQTAAANPQAEAAVAAAQAQAAAATQAAASQAAAPQHVKPQAPSRVEVTDDDDASDAARAGGTTRAEPANAEQPQAARPVASGKPSFAEFTKHQAAIEKMIDADPSLLARVPGAMALYKKMHANDAKLRTKGKLDAVNERIHQAEVYSANVDAVEELYAKISAP